jgi:hypothetical protein
MRSLKSKLIAWITSGENLIYTSIGNLPIKDLDYKVDWQFSTGEIKLREYYTYMGVIVKDGCHVYKVPKDTELYIKQGKVI